METSIYKQSAGFVEHQKTVEALMNKSGYRYERWLKICLNSIPRQMAFYKSELKRIRQSANRKE